MAEATLTAVDASRRAPGLLPRIAWRNLWRNRRRTWLTVGSIAFAIMLIVYFMALQTGSYEDMIELGTGLITGHAQVQHVDALDEPDIDHRLEDVSGLLQQLEALDAVEVAAPRLSLFALGSFGERSTGVQIMAVLPERERLFSALPGRVSDGEYLDAPGEAVVGQRLADNLDMALGDELVILGTGADGSVAALAVVVTGLITTGIAELDRSLVQLHYRDAELDFTLPNAAHNIALITQDPAQLPQLLASVSPTLSEGIVVRGWPVLMPDLYQGIEIDRVSGRIMYLIILGMVAFSVVNTFVLILFERRREFGVLLALGMKPWRIVLMVHLEALALWLLGAGIGLGIALLAVAGTMSTGIYLGDDMQQMAQEMYMPTHMYPGLDPMTITFAPLVMLVATQVAALVGSARILRLRPTEALKRD